MTLDRILSAAHEAGEREVWIKPCPDCGRHFTREGAEKHRATHTTFQPSSTTEVSPKAHG